MRYIDTGYDSRSKIAFVRMDRRFCMLLPIFFSFCLRAHACTIHTHIEEQRQRARRYFSFLKMSSVNRERKRRRLYANVHRASVSLCENGNMSSRGMKFVQKIGRSGPMTVEELQEGWPSRVLEGLKCGDDQSNVLRLCGHQRILFYTDYWLRVPKVGLGTFHAVVQGLCAARFEHEVLFRAHVIVAHDRRSC